MNRDSLAFSEQSTSESEVSYGGGPALMLMFIPKYHCVPFELIQSSDYCSGCYSLRMALLTEVQ